MSIALVTGAAGLIGSAACRHFAKRAMDTVGIDNDIRKVFFGDNASTYQVDFSINANGTLNLLQATRDHCPEIHEQNADRWQELAVK